MVRLASSSSEGKREGEKENERELKNFFFGDDRDIAAASKENRVLDPLQIYQGHTAGVEVKKQNVMG